MRLGGLVNGLIVIGTSKELAMLRILYGACSTALDAFRAADNPVDDQLVTDLEAMVARTKDEIERLSASLASASGQHGYPVEQ